MGGGRGNTWLENLAIAVFLYILVAIFVPVYDSYSRRSVTAEATLKLRQMFDESVAYYFSSSHRGHAGPVPRQFPRSVSSTPGRTACRGSESVKAAPNPAYWTEPTWRALQFSIERPSSFQYDYVSSGTEDKAMFTAGAHGDLNCDGVLSTFERMGTITADGMVSGGPGIFKKDPLE